MRSGLIRKRNLTSLNPTNCCPRNQKYAQINAYWCDARASRKCTTVSPTSPIPGFSALVSAIVRRQYVGHCNDLQWHEVHSFRMSALTLMSFNSSFSYFPFPVNNAYRLNEDNAKLCELSNCCMCIVSERQIRMDSSHTRNKLDLLKQCCSSQFQTRTSLMDATISMCKVLTGQ